jgi:hypothetical protein
MLLCTFIASLAIGATKAPAPVEIQRSDQKGLLRVLIDGKEAVVYQFAADLDMPHYYPVRSPSGRSLTVQHPSFDLHHRSVWFADTVQLAGQRKASFYNAFHSKDKKKPEAGFRNRIRHVKFLGEDADDRKAAVKAQLVWEMDYGKTPVLDEFRRWQVAPLGKGEYLLDLSFELKASYGDVKFVSDAIHYAWPYVRIEPKFAGKNGGTLTNSEGGVKEKGTHDKPARWVDYSNAVDGVTEGLAIFQAATDEPCRWLTREYGTFGPRRADAQSGKPFTLNKGDSLKQHVAILVHSGDVNAGRVKQRYRQFIEDRQ